MSSAPFVPLPVPAVTPVVPPLGKRGSLDNEYVRHFIFDRWALDNPLLMDLEFSDEEISFARWYAGADYNGMEPQVDYIDPAAVPYVAAAIFLNGIVYHLHLAKMLQLQRNDVTYEAGNMTVDINKSRIASLKESAKYFRDEFNRMAADRKRTININQAYRSVGGGWNNFGGY